MCPSTSKQGNFYIDDERPLSTTQISFCFLTRLIIPFRINRYPFKLNCNFWVFTVVRVQTKVSQYPFIYSFIQHLIPIIIINIHIVDDDKIPHEAPLLLHNSYQKNNAIYEMNAFFSSFLSDHVRMSHEKCRKAFMKTLCDQQLE